MAVPVALLNQFLDKIIRPSRVDAAVGMAPIGPFLRCLDILYEKQIADRSSVAIAVLAQMPRELDRRENYVQNEVQTESKSGLGLRVGYRRFVLGHLGCGVYFSPSVSLELVDVATVSARSRRADAAEGAATPGTATRNLTWAAGDLALTAGAQVPIAEGLSIDVFCGAYVELLRWVTRDHIALSSNCTAAHAKDFTASKKTNWSRESLRAPFPFLRAGFYVCLDR